MRLITFEDIIDLYNKARQRGMSFIFSKFNFKGVSRTKSAFSETYINSSNWWIIPKVNERWNKLITGNAHQNYEQFLMQNILKNETDLKLLSLGSGTSSHELELASYLNFKEIICVDIAQNRLLEAEKIAKDRNLNNIKFIYSNIKDFNFPEKYFDIVLFNSSLHHFDNVEKLLNNTIKNCLKNSGKLIINEYVGPDRLQFPANQIKAINEALELIPLKYKKRFKSNLIKKRFYGSGIIRMIVADPSECVDSANILPSIHANYLTILEKPYGGNILMNVLKDISHHFVQSDSEKDEVLEKLFKFEDVYLTNNKSDFVFGIYEKNHKQY